MRRDLRRVLLCTVLMTQGATGQGGSQASPHHVAHDCLREWSATCGEVCGTCHLTESPSASTLLSDPNEGGDAVICSPCHSDKTNVTGGSAFLLNGHGGSHPVGVPYRPYESSADLVPDPRGPKLFCKRDSTDCLVGCSTCHDPMADSPLLLRVSNRGSALCLCCHQKGPGSGKGVGSSPERGGGQLR